MTAAKGRHDRHRRSQKWRPRQDKLSIMTKTNEQLTKAIDAKLEILKITMKQSVTAIEKKNISYAIVLHVEKES